MLDQLVEWALAHKFPQESWSTQPTNKRVFLESTLGNKKSTITEKDLTPEEIQYLANKWKERTQGAIATIKPYEDMLRKKLEFDDTNKIKDKKLYPAARREFEKSLRAIELAKVGIYNEDWQKINKGNFGYFGNMGLQDLGLPDQHRMPEGKRGYLANPNVKYEDYNSLSRRADTGKNPDETIQTLLGKYRYSMNRNGKPVITDTYDFNPGGFGGTVKGGTSEMGVDGGEVGGSSGIYDMVRSYAGNKLPPGKGRDVYINLP